MFKTVFCEFDVDSGGSIDRGELLEVCRRFDPEASDKNGIPKIYSVSPSRGDSAGRLVITDKPSKTSGVITF
jgi:Ca2+-binding EF-hand superfamily protein